MHGTKESFVYRTDALLGGTGRIDVSVGYRRPWTFGKLYKISASPQIQSNEWCPPPPQKKKKNYIYIKTDPLLRKGDEEVNKRIKQKIYI